MTLAFTKGGPILWLSRLGPALALSWVSRGNTAVKRSPILRLCPSECFEPPICNPYQGAVINHEETKEAIPENTTPVDEAEISETELKNIFGGQYEGNKNISTLPTSKRSMPGLSQSGHPCFG